MKRFLILCCLAVSGSCGQEAEQQTITLISGPTQQTFLADAKGGAGEIAFETTGAWSSAITEETQTRAAATWLEINPSSGNYAGNHTANITLKANYTGRERKATITITSGGQSIQTTMTQKSTLANGQTLRPTIDVAAQNGLLQSGTAGTATFAVTTTGIAEGSTGAVQWFSSALGATSTPTPTGISAAVSGVTNNAAAVTVSATDKAAAGTYHFRTTIDGLTSTVSKLTVNPSELLFTDDAKYDIPAMRVGMRIADIDLSEAVSGGSGHYTFSAEGVPAGLSISTQGVISGAPTAVFAAGEALITVTDTTTPTPQTRSITIAYGTATIAVTGVVLNKSSMIITAGTSETLTATVAPSNASDKGVEWESSDKTVAEVDAAGKVTTLKIGTATITATTRDGKKIANCTVTVKSAVGPGGGSEDWGQGGKINL